MHPQRLLVLDENLPHRLKTELDRRGRTAIRLSELGLKGSDDADLLKALDQDLPDWILVTADDKMPLAHAVAVTRVAATIATVDPRHPGTIGLDQWRCEVVHRWAHRIHEQEMGTVRR
jgi:hypothetical protein